jgi:hypothetical protein
MGFGKKNKKNGQVEGITGARLNGTHKTINYMNIKFTRNNN